MASEEATRVAEAVLHALAKDARRGPQITDAKDLPAWHARVASELAEIIDRETAPETLGEAIKAASVHIDHTPTPYAVYPGRNRHYVDAPADGYEHAMQDCYYMAGPDGPSHFVADVIVRSDAEGAATVAFFRDACNSHAALGAACRSVVETMEYAYGLELDDWPEYAIAAKDALALAAKPPEGGA